MRCEPSARRQQYRSKPSDEQKVTTFVHLPSGEALAADVVDVSVTGAALRLSVDWDPVLKQGDVVELSIGLEGRKPVKTPGEVMFSEQDGQRHTRYGFRYTNPGNLYAQLDEQYARLFNRRGAFRAAATLEQRIPIHLAWQGFMLDTKIHDISSGGVGVMLDKREAILFRGADILKARFKLEQGGELLEGRLRIVHRSQKSGGNTLIGMSFDFDDAEGFGRHAEVIKAFVTVRNTDIEGWEGSWRVAG